jgi:chloramphenicol-sensitive protein RarD
MEASRTFRVGVLCALGAYFWWGLVAVYFKAVAEVPALEVIAHRVVWSVVMLNGVLVVQKRWRFALASVLRREVAVVLLGSTVLIAINWFTFIYAVSTDRVIEASLGYFINPLVSIVLGYFFLGERLGRTQVLCVLLAGLGVLLLVFGVGVFPWISLVLAGSFGLYGLLRKTVVVDSVVGLTAEVALLTPLAIGYLVYARQTGRLVFGHESIELDGLLTLAGVMTAVPLLLFTMAARRLPLAMVGILQFIAPSLQFVLGVLVYDETFTRSHLVAFGCIWVALVVYSVDVYWRLRSRTIARGSASAG